MKPRRGQNFTCEQCGKEFYRGPHYIRLGHQIRYCSKGCYSAACAAGTFTRPGPRPHRRNGQTFICRYCGDEFYRKASFIKRGITKTCGKRECISASMRKDGNPYWGKEHSEAVRAALREIRTAKPEGARRSGPPKGWKPSAETRAKLSEALRQRWLTNRDLMLSYIKRNPKPRDEQRYRRNFTPWQRRNWKAEKCVWCGSEEELVLDHIVAVRDGGSNIKENAQTLCQPCNIWKATYIDRPLHLARLALQGG